MFVLLLLPALCAALTPLSNRTVPTPGLHVPVRVRRFVHRHSCVGLENEQANESAADVIGCAEEEAVPFEHLLTPSMMWCNDKTCLSEFGKPFEVHFIRCTPHHCTVRLHCAEALEHIKYAGLLTIVAVVVLLLIPAFLPALLPQMLVSFEQRRAALRIKLS